MKTIGDIYLKNNLTDVEVGKTGTYVLKQKPEENIYLSDKETHYTQTVKFLSQDERDEAAIILDRNYIKYRKDDLSLLFPKEMDISVIERLLKLFNIQSF